MGAVERVEEVARVGLAREVMAAADLVLARVEAPAPAKEVAKEAAKAAVVRVVGLEAVVRAVARPECMIRHPSWRRKRS